MASPIDGNALISSSYFCHDLYTLYLDLLRGPTMIVSRYSIYRLQIYRVQHLKSVRSILQGTHDCANIKRLLIGLNHVPEQSSPYLSILRKLRCGQYNAAPIPSLSNPAMHHINAHCPQMKCMAVAICMNQKANPRHWPHLFKN